MLANLAGSYIEATSFILFGIGLTTLMLHKNLIKKLIGFNIMETSIFLFLTAQGYITGRRAPIIVDGITDYEYYINPLPSALVLTGIVVAVSITAFMLVLCLKVYEHYGTLDMDKISILALAEKEGGEAKADANADADI